jgi:hypothetical protein
MLTERWTAPSVARTAIFLFPLTMLVSGCQTQPATEPSKAPVQRIGYDAQGNLLAEDARRLDEILAKARSKPPTHIFIAAHGWLNTPESADQSYEAMRELLFEVARNQKLLPKDYQALRLGIYWPSMKLKKTKEELTADSEKAVAKALSGVDDSGSPSANPSKSEKFHLDVKNMQGLLQRNAKKGSADFERDFAKAHEIFRRQALALGFEPLEAEDLPDLNSIEQALQLYTYWQMKKRAGIEGKNGVNGVIARLQKAFPQASVHLIGHSFGCKVMLAALTADLPRPVDSVVLLQGAVSFQAFADKVVGIKPDTEGGYRKVLSQVNGPIVATFSSLDHAVGVDYPLASQLARQIGECDDKPAGKLTVKKWYQGLGGTGICDKEPVMMEEEGGKYGFDRGLYSIDASKYVGGHSEIYNNNVAWLIWAAVLRR